LLDAFDQRIEGDYGIEVPMIEQDVRELIDQANEFLQTTQSFLNVKTG
jgi:uncharacterized protein (UPF0332 family)